MIVCKIENIIMQTPIFSISSEAFKRMVLKGKGAEILEEEHENELAASGNPREHQIGTGEIYEKMS